MPVTGYLSAASDGGLLLAYPIRRGWLAIGFYREIDGSLHLADLSIVPGEIPADNATVEAHGDRYELAQGQCLSEMRAGRWLSESLYLRHARETKAIEGARPKGVYARLIREVPLEQMQKAANIEARNHVDLAEALKRAKAPATHAAFAAPLRAARDDLTEAKLEYLRAARAFTRMWSTNDNAAIAAHLGITPDELHNWLSAARKSGYLTSPGQGRRGGELTPIGKALAARHLKGTTKKEAGK